MDFMMGIKILFYKIQQHEVLALGLEIQWKWWWGELSSTIEQKQSKGENKQVTLKRQHIKSYVKLEVRDVLLCATSRIPHVFTEHMSPSNLH